DEYPHSPQPAPWNGTATTLAMAIDLTKPRLHPAVRRGRLHNDHRSPVIRERFGRHRGEEIPPAGSTTEIAIAAPQAKRFCGLWCFITHRWVPDFNIHR